MLGKLLLAMVATLAIFVILAIGYFAITSDGGYSAGPLNDGEGYPLLCKKKKTANPSSGKYTTTGDNKTHDVTMNLSAALAKLNGNATYVVDSRELLGVTTPQPGSLRFTYQC